MLSRLARVVRIPSLAMAAGPLAVPLSGAGFEGRAVEPVAYPNAANRTTARASFGNIQALRGVAAALVMLSHAVTYMAMVRGTAEAAWKLDELAGQMGVAVFFAISGFLMAGLVTRGDPWRFLAHRIVRIFPTYFAVVALVCLVFAALKISVGLGIPCLALAPVGPRTYPLNVEWTLVYETSFYIGVFLLALAGGASRLVPAACAWLAALALAWFILPTAARAEMNPPLYLLPFSACCVPFVGGLLLPRLITAGWIRPALAWAMIPFVIACLAVGSDAQRWLCGIAAVLVVGAATVAKQITQDRPFGRVATLLGDWSYVLYLVHVPVILLVARYAPEGWSGPHLWAAAIVASVAVTSVLGPLDVALYRRLRRAVDRASGIGLRKGMAAYLAIFMGFAGFGVVDAVKESQWRARAEVALSALPADGWSAASIETVIAERGIALPNAVHGEVESFDRVSRKDAILGAWAFDPARSRQDLALAVFCDGRLAALDRPRRLRPQLAAQPGLESSRGKRIGYRLRVPVTACTGGSEPVAILIGHEGRLAVLPAAAKPVALSALP